MCKIAGTIIESDNFSDYSKDERQWITFDSVQNLLVDGGGTFNGKGKTWWDNSCKNKRRQFIGQGTPTVVTFYKCNNLTVQNLKFQDAQQIHVSFEKCTDLVAYKLDVDAPKDSPNNDAIQVTDTQNIKIMSDDCISIVSGSRYVNATDTTCGPGHGISIGSLGAKNSQACVGYFCG
ncbi:hypothetical protein OROHE_010484 [Orobanche hederae]